MTGNIDKRNNLIDILKGLCILMVIVTHCNWSDDQRRFFLFPFWIDMAVPIFMLITGYVYTKSFIKNEIETLDDAYNKKYLIKNFIRYTVPYIIAFAIEFIAYAISYFRHSSSIKSLAVLGAYTFFRGGAGPGSYYYPIMIQVIIIFPIIFMLVRRHGFKGVLITAFIALFLELTKNPYFLTAEQYRLLLFRYFLLLSFGSYFALNKMKQKTWVISIIGFFFIILFNYTHFTPKLFKWWTGTSMLPVLFIVPFFAFFVERKGHCRFIEIIGRASYNIFLTQMVFFDLCYRHKIILSEKIENAIFNSLISVIICLTAGLLFYKVESIITQRIILLALKKTGNPIKTPR